MVIVNMLINAMNLNQKYFLKKYEYFNKEYNLVNDEKKIKLNVIMNYAMKNGFSKALISFVLCLIIYYLIEYILFNIRSNINSILLEKSLNINKLNRKIIELMKLIRIKIIIYFSISSFILILSFIYLINFSFAYPGGVVDSVSNSIITFILLQIFPFISSLIICIMRYLSILKNNRILYQLSQLLFS